MKTIENNRLRDFLNSQNPRLVFTPDTGPGKDLPKKNKEVNDRKSAINNEAHATNARM